jgi:hypothetical protein
MRAGNNNNWEQLHKASFYCFKCVSEGGRVSFLWNFYLRQSSYNDILILMIIENKPCSEVTWDNDLDKYK